MEAFHQQRLQHLNGTINDLQQEIKRLHVRDRELTQKLHNADQQQLQSCSLLEKLRLQNEAKLAEAKLQMEVS